MVNTGSNIVVDGSCDCLGGSWGCICGRILTVVSSGSGSNATGGKDGG